MIQTRSLFTTFRFCPLCKIATEWNILNGRICCTLCGYSMSTVPALVRIARFFRCWR